MRSGIQEGAPAPNI